MSVHNSRKTNYTLIRLAKAGLVFSCTVILYTILGKNSYTLIRLVKVAFLFPCIVIL